MKKNKKTLDRRNFLGHGIAGLGGLSLASTAPSFLSFSSSVLAAEEAKNDRVLVVLQLSGGNDGLSTVVPTGDDAYYKNRPTMAIKKGDALKLNDYSGFHPVMKRMHAIHGEGELAIVQGASYPNPNRSHFKAMDIWHTADARGRGVDTGWLGRTVDSCCPKSEDPNLVVNLGQAVPYALEAKKHKPVSFTDPRNYRWTGSDNDKGEFEKLNRPVTAAEQIEWLHRVSVDAQGSSDAIRAAARDYRPKVQYPGAGRQRLGADLRTVAALIRAKLSTRVYYVSFGGFDTHNNQLGRHTQLMTQLDGALGAFWADLKAQGIADRVCVMVFSEFGRRVKENASRGSDHGVAGPMFLLGQNVKGGVHAKHPSLTDLDRGDLKMSCDFRSVYQSVLEDWIQTDPVKVLGRRFPPLPLL
ncbi:MAG: DUF1501 domain-containing protein [Planctomycetota bacterium]